MKKLLSIVLSLCIILTAFSVLPAAFTARERDEAEVGDTYTSGFYEYEYLDANSVVITRYTGTAINLIIPSSLGGYTVSKIGAYAFSMCDSLQRITIPDTVRVIDKCAFELCSSLYDIKFGKGLEYIGESAFTCCDRLEFLNFNDSLQVIEDNAFYNDRIMHFAEIPASVTFIGNRAFGYYEDEHYESTRDKTFVIKGYADTDAERYAFENEFTFIDLTPAEPTEPDIPAQFIPSDAKLFNGHYYKVYNEAVDWTVAKENCEKLGGHLAVVTSSEEQSFIISLNPGNAWIGGYRETRNDWKWVTGETFDYSSWLEGEPNDSANVIPHENRIAVWPDNWNDLNEESREQSGYICEWEPENPVIPIIPGGKATVTLYDLQGKSETAEFETGDTFTVYTMLNTSDIDGGKIATLSGEQTYDSGILKLVDELDSEKLIADTDKVFPVTKSRSMGNCMTKGIIYFSATESNISSPFVFNSDKCKLIVTTYKVIATGSVRINTKLNMLTENDYTLTRIISDGSVTSDSYKVKLRSSFKDPEIEPYKLGDANADDEVDTVDATLVQRAATKIRVPYSDEQMLHADIDIDGSLTVLDATFIQRYATRTKVPYPIGEYVSE